MRLHVLALPHTQTTSVYSFCAFTARSIDFCTMMTRNGYEVVLYGSQENEAEVSEFVSLATDEDKKGWWPDYDPLRDVFNDFDPNGVGWSEWNKRIIDALRQRIQPEDIVCYTMGWSQHPVMNAIAETGIPNVEIGIGYEGVFAPYRVYESNAWRSFLMGKRADADTDRVRLYDEVIPRAYNPDDFPAGDGVDGYFLFVGRLIDGKGPHIASQTCQRIGAKLLVAGQGAASVEPGRKIVCGDGTELEGDVEYVGVVGPKRRAELMGGAYATFVPTLYFEPFGGVSVESQLTGTPVLVTPSGGLPENICGRSQVCRTLAEFTEAACSMPFLNSMDRLEIRREAKLRYGFGGVVGRWDDYLERLQGLSAGGWYA